MAPIDPTLEELVQNRIEASLRIKTELLQQSAQIARIADRIIQALKSGKSILIFGNGGSAADAQHIVGELVGRFYLERAPLPAIALNTNSSLVTSIGNDYDFSQVFSRQVQALGEEGDVAIGLSTSGNSPNVLEAIRVAREMGMVTIALTGESGGGLKSIADECLCVPSTDTPRIQEAHILIGHILCEIVERQMFTPTHD